MATTVALDAETLQSIDALVESGAYRSSADVVRVAIEMVAQRQRKLDAFDREIRVALDSCKTDGVIEFDDAFALFEEELAKVSDRRAA